MKRNKAQTTTFRKLYGTEDAPKRTCVGCGKVYRENTDHVYCSPDCPALKRRSE